MNIGRKDVAWGYVSLLLLQAVNVILLPFVLFYLTSNELGLWYSFTSLYSLAMLIDFGFKTTLSRNISYIWSGANDIKASGIHKEELGDDWNEKFFIKLSSTIKSIYYSMGLIILILLLTIGTFYIYTISINQLDMKIALTAWFFYLFAVILNIAFAYWNSMLKGIGAIKEYNQILIITKLIQLFLSVLFLMLGYGIVGVSLAYLISVLCNRIIIVKNFYNYNGRTKILKGKIRTKFNKEIFMKLLPNTVKTGVNSISNYFVIGFPVLLSSYFLGLQFAGNFGIVNQIVTLILTLSNSFFNTFLPKFNFYRIKNNIKSLKILFTKAMIINYMINIILFSLFLILGPTIIQLISQENSLLPTNIMILVVIYRFLYNNQSLFVSMISTKNIVPYKSFIISSIIIVCLQLLCMQINNNIYNLIIPIILVQLAFNNWYWPLVSIKDLRRV